jgi:ElaB/YqjD/DUF883 family membrane-anchored ribosome-binding protein
MADDNDSGSGTIGSAASDAHRAVDEVRSLLDVATREDLAERTAHVKAKLDEARASLTRAAGEASGTFGPVLQEAEKEFREEIEAIELRVRENPLGALLAAAGVGLLLGLAFSRNR